MNQQEFDARVLALCDSPIEKLMAQALVFVAGQFPETTPDDSVVFPEPPARWSGVTLIPQCNVTLGSHNYRLDFALIATIKGVERKVAVECDGHEYHDRTKEQASHDRARDRACQTAGWLVARFTGSDLYRDPVQCARDAWGMLGGDAAWPNRYPKPDRPRPEAYGFGRQTTQKPPRVRMVLPGAALDALALFAAFPSLGDAAAEEGLSALLPDGPVADIARDLFVGGMSDAAFLARVAASSGQHVARRAEDVITEIRKRPDGAERMLRRAILKGKIDLIQDEQARLHAIIARSGSPVPEDLRIRVETAYRRRADLDKRLRGLEREGA